MVRLTCMFKLQNDLFMSTKIYQLNAPDSLNLEVKLPASKSICNRALMVHALSGSKLKLRNLSDCDDTRVMLKALEQPEGTIDIGAAGTAMRFLTALFSVLPGERTLTGSERMRHRPIAVLVDALRFMGADISYGGEEGFPPLKIRGQQLQGGHVEVRGDISSQYISALLMIGPTLEHGLELHLNGEIVSRPYIDLTLHIMHQFGVQIEWSDTQAISVSPQHYAERDYLIENDWSAASYWYEILALLGDDESRVCLPGLHDASRQGDSQVRYIFSLLGVKTLFDSQHCVRLSRHNRTLPRLDYDFINTPDLVQTLVATCLGAEISFRFTGVGNLRIKETDRIEALRMEARKLGYVLDTSVEGEISWNGDHCQPTFEPIDTYDDHRMAMAFAPLAIKFPGLCIANPQVVTKSYPTFWDDLRRAGFSIEKVPSV